MKTQSAGLQAHRQQSVTTLAWCWKVTRADGRVYGFTSVDIPLTIDGVTYEAATGITPSAIAGNADLAVRNLEAAGMLDSESITEADLLAGLWDGAAVEVFEVNYADLSQGRMILATGTIGNVNTGRSNYTAEVRGLAQALQQPIGEVVTAGCQALLGDARCKVDVEALRIPFTAATAATARSFTSAELDDACNGGVVTWVTGQNAGYSMEIRSATEEGAIALVLFMPYPIVAGDTGTAIPGCLKRREEDCRLRFNNVINFRGFPDLPGNDRILGAASLKGGQ